jgi:16S rRNA (uracil1498-N3)-methyltransferase
VLPRFFAPDAGKNAAASLVTLPADESTHLARVMRIARGGAIRVFNGIGGEWRAEVVTLARDAVVIRLLEAATPVAEPSVRITLALAVLKGDKMDDVVRDAVMLGAGAIQPLITVHTETSLAAVARGERIARWRRIAIASAKQCGRAVVPDVSAPLIFTEWLRTGDRGGRVMFVEPAVSAPTRHLRTLKPADHAALIVGPEGGWTSDEVAAGASAGATLATLGNITIRADAMPIVALTAIRTLWQDL